jgi:hypothetical protein
MSDLSRLRDSTSLGRKRIFAIVSAPRSSGAAGKAVRRILIFDNHPDSLRLIFERRPGPAATSSELQVTRRRYIVLGLLLTLILLAILWLLL